ncbi:hypothetical protein ABEF95_001081 [Exophiala dermatitidis]
MRSVSRLVSIVGLVVLGSSLVYLFQHGPVVPTSLDSADLWQNFAEAATSYRKGPDDDGNGNTTTTHCPPLKPNLIISAIDGSRWQDQIFIFMQSLTLALGEESLSAMRSLREAKSSWSCPPAPVEVKIIVPQSLLQDLPWGFRALEQRYPSLQFVGALPEIADVAVVLRRFQGWADLLTKDKISDKYDKVLACDLDVVFQRNPFTMPLSEGVEILYFAEWRGLKIGQCSVHRTWFEQCASTESGVGGYIDPKASATYMSRDRICAGSVYGTARAITVYMNTMASQLRRSNYHCNDQAMHIHIYYSGLLEYDLESNGYGRVSLVANDEALFGSVGTTPMVTFNEWGEILNEKGQVQVAVHQYKTHAVLSEIVRRKYGWMAEVGRRKDALPQVAELERVEGTVTKSAPDRGSGSGSDSSSDSVSGSGTVGAGAGSLEDLDLAAVSELKHVRHDEQLDGSDQVSVLDLPEYRLVNVSSQTCGKQSDLCSCKYEDCQVHYEWY